MENIELDELNETEDKREKIKQKLRQYYDGRIVRKMRRRRFSLFCVKEAAIQLLTVLRLY